MKNQFAKFVQLSSKVNRQHIQVAMTLLALVLFVLGAGAPADGGRLPR
jgi:hypothetical protein